MINNQKDSTASNIYCSAQAEKNNFQSYFDEITKLQEYLKRNEQSHLILYILRGVSGSGKSTLSHKLIGNDGVILSTDEFFTTSQGYKFDSKMLSEAHKWNEERAFVAMEAQISPIIIDNTNLQAWEPRPYVIRGLEKGYKVQILEPDTPWKKDPVELAKRNKHGITAEIIRRMIGRWEQYTLEDVLKSSPPNNTHKSKQVDQQQTLSPEILKWKQKLKENESSELVLYILRGISGSGKSTLSTKLSGDQGVIFSSDSFFMKGSHYNFDPKQLLEAHRWNQQRSFVAIDSKISPIVIDNTNLQAWEAKPYVVKAIESGYRVEIVEPNTPWKKNPQELAKKNVHSVSIETIYKMLLRLENYSIFDVLVAQPPDFVNRKVSQPKQNQISNLDKNTKPLITNPFSSLEQDEEIFSKES